MTDIQNCFSKSYAEARQKFLSAAQAAGLAVDSNIHPLKGRDGEELAMDVVLDGAPDAQRLPWRGRLLRLGCADPCPAKHRLA